jgi:hypothetical protein
MLAVFALLLSLLNFAVLPIPAHRILADSGAYCCFLRYHRAVFPQSGGGSFTVIDDDGLVFAPADGRVCVMEEVTDI